MKQELVLSPKELNLLKKDKKLILGDSNMQFIITIKKEQYFDDGFMEHIDKEVKEAEKSWPFFDSAKEAMQYLISEVKEW